MYQLLSERLLFGGTHGDCSSQRSYHVFPVHTSAATSELTFTVFPSLMSYTTLCLPQLPLFAFHSPGSSESPLPPHTAF